jgi:hypothetical protein
LIETKHFSLELNVLGITLSIPFNLTVTVIVMAAGLTAAGMDWLLRGHPHYDGRATFQHWILPALTALVLGVPLYNLAPGPVWWLSFALGGVLLLLIFLAEYIVLDSSDVRYPAAAAGLSALSYALFTILITTLAFSAARLAFIEIAVFPAVGLVVLRVIHLRTSKWEFAWAGGIAFVLAQFAAALHYWPLLPIQYGLALLGPLYALTGFALNLSEEVSPPRAGVEAAIGLAVVWLAAILLRG